MDQASGSNDEGLGRSGRGRAVITVFLENRHGKHVDIKQAMATCLNVNQRNVLVTAAHNIKVPLPSQERRLSEAAQRALNYKTYDVRAILVFGEHEMRELSGAWAIMPDAAAEGFLKEGVDFCICPGFNNFKPERKDCDFAMIHTGNAVELAQHQSGKDAGIFNVLKFMTAKEDFAKILFGKPTYDLFEDTFTKYEVSGYPAVDKVSGTCAELKQQIANRNHPLWTRAPTAVPLRARHTWEYIPPLVSGLNASWKMPESDRQRKEIAPFFKFLDKAVLLRPEVPVDEDLMLAQGIRLGFKDEESDEGLDQGTASALKVSLCGAPWVGMKNPDDPVLLGMLVGGPSTETAEEGRGGLYVGLMFNEKFRERIEKMIRTSSTNQKFRKTIETMIRTITTTGPLITREPARA
jgi:hypothetical protein